jgi:hypothetical protein
MSGPQNVNPRPLAMGSLEELEERFAGRGWSFFEQQFHPAATPADLDPGDQFKRQLAGVAETAWGRQLIDWLLDLTCRAPYPVTSQSIEDLAMAAAKHQARAAIGEVLVKAIADGRRIMDQPKEPSR